MILESSFLDLRCKEVINVVDGRRLGHITDVCFDLNSGKITGFVVPGEISFWNVFKNGNELFIPYSQICKIGEDSILVEIYSPSGTPQANAMKYFSSKNQNTDNQ